MSRKIGLAFLGKITDSYSCIGVDHDKKVSDTFL